MSETISVPLLAVSDRQDLYSMAYVRAIVGAAGFNFSKPELDRNSRDLQVEHAEFDGFIPSYQGLIIQVKCTYSHTINRDGTIHYPLPVENYNDLRQEKIRPRILVLVLVPRPDLPEPEPWIECLDKHTVFRYRAYWLSLMGAKPTDNTVNITVKVPTQNIFDVEAVHLLMDHMVARGNKQWSR